MKVHKTSTKTKKYPLLLTPVPKEVLWGGERLKRFYNKRAPFDRIAESWELTVRPEGVNTIANGLYEGMALSDYVKHGGKDVLGTAFSDADPFPLLIKFIDARDDLSVQVHPDDAYALRNENDSGKTEMWYILEADPGAKLVYGLRKDASPRDLREALAGGDIGSVLFYADVKKGDVFFIPPGQLHAIGGGILLCEIQQNSNVTYRVYDYDRVQSDGTKRMLHTEKAMDVLRIWGEEEIEGLRFAKGKGEPDLLCACPYFTVRRVDVEDTFSLNVTEESFVSLIFLAAEDTLICWDGTIYTVAKGDSVLLPAGLGEVSLTGRAEVLITTA